MRAAAFVVIAALGNAPLQCSRSPDPDLRREDTAGDALWALSRDFEKQGNHDAARATLRFLVERYPSNRYAPAAREELAAKGGEPKPEGPE
jgi:outer membrane protein assembly factor BamD (BamD/ComL family)